MTRPDRRATGAAVSAVVALALAACAGRPVRTDGGSGGSVVEIVLLEPAPAADRAADAPPPDTAPEVAPPPLEPAAAALDPSAAVPGESHLRGLHPALAERAVALVRALAADGIAVKIIFGYTPYTPRKRSGPGGWSSWHEFGLAFDLNLEPYKSLGAARARFADDAPRWARIGAVASDLGLVWGGAWRSSYDPFHFEWHPGADPVINKQDLAAFLRLAGKRGREYQRVWSLYPAPAR